jgi:hypothetical protein
MPPGGYIIKTDLTRKNPAEAIKIAQIGCGQEVKLDKSIDRRLKIRIN